MKGLKIRYAIPPFCWYTVTPSYQIYFSSSPLGSQQEWFMIDISLLSSAPLKLEMANCIWTGISTYEGLALRSIFDWDLSTGFREQLSTTEVYAKYISFYFGIRRKHLLFTLPVIIVKSPKYTYILERHFSIKHILDICIYYLR